MARKSAEGELNDMQQKFCDEYRIDLCVKQAAIRAGYSPASAASQGSTLLSNPNVRARIDKMLAEDSKRTGVSVDRVIRELMRVALADPTRVIDLDTGELRATATEDDLAALQSVRVKMLPPAQPGGEPGFEREIRMADKLKALDLIGRHIGMYGVREKRALDKRRVEIEADRLDMERAKSGAGASDERDVGVVMMPPVTPAEDDGGVQT